MGGFYREALLSMCNQDIMQCIKACSYEPGLRDVIRGGMIY